MSIHEAKLELEFGVPPARLWEAITDHEGMAKWTGAKVRLVARGDADGIGAVRRVRVGALALDEEVVYADAPRRLVYRIVRGAPVTFHRGEMLVIPTERGSLLRWNIVLVSPVPGFARITARTLELALGRGLRELRGLIGG
ncbi:MAG: SRPBCC family protein [Sandaracinus sp.]